MNNPWVKYSARDYLTIKQSIIDRLQNPVDGISEITDYSEGNQLIKEIGIWSGLTEMIGYYVDNRARDQFLSQARKYESAAYIAQQNDYRIKSSNPSSGTLTFTINTTSISVISIPLGTEVQREGAITYLTTEAATIEIGETEVDVPAKQWTLVPDFVVAVSDGSEDQSYVIAGNVVDNSLQTTIGASDIFTPEDTFAFSDSTSKIFVAGLDEFRQFILSFGDGVSGEIPANTEDININYFTTLGAAGNAFVGEIDTINSVISLPGGITIKVINNAEFTGGNDGEDLRLLKKRIPRSLRTQNRMVTRTDHVFVTETAPGVEGAGVIFDCGKDIKIYITPIGGGLANQTLLDDTLLYLSDKKMVATRLLMFAAGEVTLQFKITLNLLPNFFRATVAAEAEQALIDEYSAENQEIGGTTHIGNVYQLMEAVEGVNASVVNKMTVLPFALPVEITDPVLNWTRSTKDTVNDHLYRIRFFSTTDFQLLKDNVFIGNFIVNVPVETDDIVFTIDQAYANDNSWTFRTYINGNVIALDEPSLFTTDALNIEIITIGGI